MAMIRVSQSIHSGKIISRRRVLTRITRSDRLYARYFDKDPSSATEEKYWRDHLGVWRRKRPDGSQFRVWLEEEKDGN